MLGADDLATNLEGDRDRLVRLVRRLCLLREQGHSAEAAQLEATGLPPLLKAFGIGAGSTASARDALAEIYAAEKERVANAVVLAELIAAQLDRSHPAVAPAGRAANPFPPLPADISAGEVPAGSPAIPDLLDAMLAHDRSAARRAASTLAGPGPSVRPTTHQK